MMVFKMHKVYLLVLLFISIIADSAAYPCNAEDEIAIKAVGAGNGIDKHFFGILHLCEKEQFGQGAAQRQLVETNRGQLLENNKERSLGLNEAQFVDCVRGEIPALSEDCLKCTVGPLYQERNCKQQCSHGNMCLGGCQECIHNAWEDVKNCANFAIPTYDCSTQATAHQVRYGGEPDTRNLNDKGTLRFKQCN